MEFEAPFKGSVQDIDKSWIDYNGHLNMAFYNVLFDKCVDEAFELVGLGPDYLEENNASFFTLEAHVTYLQELKLGDSVYATLRLLDFDAKRLHCFQELYHANDEFLSATSETMTLSVDMAAKKSAPFPHSILSRVEQMHEAHKSLPRPPQVGHVIGIPRKPA